MKTLAAVGAAALLSAPSFAHADIFGFGVSIELKKLDFKTSPIMLDVRFPGKDTYGKNATVTIKDGVGVPRVGDTWDYTVENWFEPRMGIGHSMDGYGIAEFMGANIGDPLISWAFDDFDNGTAQKIADGCRNRYPESTYEQINCASVAVHMIIRSDDDLGFGRTWCRTHARAFEEVVDRLHIAGVTVSKLAMEKHVVNRVEITGKDGKKYEYVLDVGNINGVWMPYNANARRYHDRNGDGITDVIQLPEPAPWRRDDMGLKDFVEWVRREKAMPTPRDAFGRPFGIQPSELTRFVNDPFGVRPSEFGTGATSPYIFGAGTNADRNDGTSVRPAAVATGSGSSNVAPGAGAAGWLRR